MAASYDSSNNENAVKPHKDFGITQIDASEEILQAFPDQLDDRVILKIYTNTDFLPFYIAEKFAEICNLGLIEVPVDIPLLMRFGIHKTEKAKEEIVYRVLKAFEGLLDDEKIAAFLLVVSSFYLGFFALRKR